MTTLNLRALLEEMIEKGASDLHCTAGERPKLRVDGEMSSASVEEGAIPRERGYYAGLCLRQVRLQEDLSLVGFQATPHIVQG